MKYYRQLAAVALVAAAPVIHAATIDRMYTLKDISRPHESGLMFGIFGSAWYYEMSDGSSWLSGAGFHPDTYVWPETVSVDGTTITYSFSRPYYDWLFFNSDNRVDYTDDSVIAAAHFTNGELAPIDVLKITATIGSTEGKMNGYARIISNEPNEYATDFVRDNFAYYSAPVGSDVYFEQKYTLFDSTFTESLFNTSFTYNVIGYVDFAGNAVDPETPTVPEPGILVLLATMAAGAVVASKRRSGHDTSPR